MTKWLTAVIGILFISLPLIAGAADKSAPAKQQAVTNGPAQKPDDKAQVAVPARSNVSQEAIASVKKREEARKQRDKKMKVRAKNVQSSPKNNNNLFRTSK